LIINFRKSSFKITLQDDAVGGVPLELPRQNLKVPATIVALIFVVFAAVLVSQFASLNLHTLNDTFDWVSLVFNLVWLTGWSAGVFVLGALTIFLFFARESARVQQKMVVYVVSIGPVKLIREYELGLIRNLQIKSEPDGKNVSLRFDYKDVPSILGSAMQQSTAERNLAMLNRELDKLVF
jgi:hypothetical protein